MEKLREALGGGGKQAPKAELEVAGLHGQERSFSKGNRPDGTELVYTDSSTFLKGTQSSNPHNDYCQHFVDTGQRPQNFIRDVGLADRCVLLIESLLSTYYLFWA